VDFRVSLGPFEKNWEPRLLRYIVSQNFLRVAKSQNIHLWAAWFQEYQDLPMRGWMVANAANLFPVSVTQVSIAIRYCKEAKVLKSKAHNLAFIDE
jgi:hypothetical protein